MITALVLTSLAGLLALSLPRRLRRLRRDRGPGPPSLASAHPSARAPSGEPDPPHPEPPERPEPSGPYPESMTNELEPWEEEYLACLADELWPEDEYLDLEHSIDYEGDGDHGGGMCR